jgi:hypothetical protein
MESNHDTPERTSNEAALAGVLALLIEAREVRSPDGRPESLEALFARAGLTTHEIGLVTGQASKAVDTRLNTDGPALWRTLQRRRAAMAEAHAAH